MREIEQATYVHAAESCYLCRQNGPMIDTETTIQGEGDLAICRGCIKLLAAAAGFKVIEPKSKAVA